MPRAENGRCRPLPADTQPAPLIGITSAASLCTGAFPVPIGAKIVAGVAVAYALSPIDLIPDFIPVLGYFDDLILVPTGLWLAIRLVPPALMTEFRSRAETLDQLPSSRTAAIAVVIIWIAVMAAILWAFWPVPAY